MALNGNKIDFQVGFSVDKTGLLEMQSYFQRIANAALDPGAKMDAGLQKAAKTAITLDEILTKTFNSELGTLNVIRFNQELAKAGLSIKQVESDLLGAGNKGVIAYNRLQQAILGTNLELKQTSKVLDQMATTFKNTVRYGLSSSIFNTLVGSIQKAYSYTKQLDSSLNNIRIVTGNSAENMKDFATYANEAAKNLGASTLDYTNAALIYYQQGLSEAEVRARAETTIKAANVTGQTGEEVSEQLTAVWNGYKVSAQETELYIDKLAAVAATTAADLEELSTGMSKVASAANSMGVNFDDLNAQIATIVSVTRQAPESVGTALKTIYARLGDLKVDGTDEFGVSLGEVSSQLAALGIQILDQTGNLRDMSDVMSDIAKKWDTWTEAQKQAAAIAMAGKRQYNDLVALFENWDMYTEALETSTDAIGTLQQQQDIYMESTEAKLKKLKATWQDLYGSFINTDELNSGIELLRNIVQVFDNFIDSFGGGIKTVMAFGGILTNVFNKQIIKSLNNANENRAKFQHNLELQEMKQYQVLHPELLEYNPAATPGTEQAVLANTTKQLAIAEDLLKVQSVLTSEQYNQATAIQKQIGSLEEEKRITQDLLRKTLEREGVEKKYINKFTASSSYSAYKEVTEEIEKQISLEQKKVDNTKELINLAADLNIEGEALESVLKDIEIINEKLTDEEKQELQGFFEVIQSGEDLKFLEEDILNIASKTKEKYEQQFNILAKHTTERSKMIDLSAKEINLEQELFKIIEQASSNKQLAQTFTTWSSSLSNVAMIWGSINSLSQTVLDNNATAADKILQTFITLGFTLPTIISGIKKLQEFTNIIPMTDEAIEARLAITKLNAEKETAIHMRMQAQTRLASLKIERQRLTIAEEIEKNEEDQIFAQQVIRGIEDSINDIEKEQLVQRKALRKETLKFENLKQNPMVMMNITLMATTAILSSLYMWYDYVLKKQVEEAQTTLDTIKAKEEEIKTNLELYDSYKKLYDQREDSDDIQDELYDSAIKLADAYDIQGGRVLALAGYYSELNERAQEYNQTMLDEQIKQAQQGQKSAGILAAEKSSGGIGSSGFRLPWSQQYVFSFADTLMGRSNPSIIEVQKALSNTEFGKKIANQQGTIKLNYDNPQEMKAWYDWVDDAVEYYESAYSKAYLETDYAYKELKREQTESLEAAKTLREQFDIEYQARTRQEFIARQSDLESEELTVQKLANIRQEINNVLSGTITDEEERKKYIDDYLNGLEDIEDKVSKLDLATRISEQIGKSLPEVIEQIDKFNEEQLAYLEVHLDYATLDDDLEGWITSRSKIIETLGQKGGSTALKNMLSSRTSGKEYTKTDISTLYENQYAVPFMEMSQGEFTAKDSSGQFQAVTHAWIMSTKAIEENKEVLKSNIKIQEDALLQEGKQKQYIEEQSKAEETLKRILTDKSKTEEENNELIEHATEVAKALTRVNENELTPTQQAYLDTIRKVEGQEKLNLKAIGQAIINGESYANELELLRNEYNDIDNTIYSYTKTQEQLNELIKEENSTLDSIQSAYETLTNIVKNYNKTGHFTIDNVQQLLELNDAYVASLDISEQKISLNEQAFQSLAIAKLNEMKYTALDIYYNELERIAQMEVEEASYRAARAALIAGQNYLTMGEDAKKASQDLLDLADSIRATFDLGEDVNKNALANQARKAFENRLKAADDAIAEVGKGGSNLKRAMSTSSSGGKDKNKEKKEYRDEFDRYWKIKKAIDAVDRAINKLDKDQENLHGRELINSLKQENKLLQEQAACHRLLAEEQKKEAAELQGLLNGYGVLFDELGNITNYAEATAAALQKYNDAISSYNSGLMEDEAFEKVEKNYEKFKKLIERYDTLFYTEMKDTQEKLDELFRKELANNLQAWEVEIQLKLDWKQLERDWNDFLTEISEDFKSVFKDLRVDLKSMLTDAGTYTGSEGTVNSIIGAVHDVAREIDTMMGGGSSSMFESVSQAQEKLKELNEQLLDAGKSLHDLWKNAWDNYLDGIDQVDDAFDQLMDRFERINDELEFQGKLIELLYGDEAYQLMSKLYEGQEKNTEVQLQSLKTQVDMWKQLFEESGATMENQLDWDKDQQKYYEQWMEAQQALNNLVIDYIELIKKDYLNTVSDVLKQFEKFVSNGSTLDDINTEWERISANADKYYDSVEGAYYIQTLANKIDKSIADSSSLKAQQKLMALREKEITYLREKENLTEYDIKAAELRYQLALREIALQESQQNKTGMKLTRNEQGNWSYQYVADEEDIASKRQELLDAYNDLYQLASDAYEANLEALQDLQEKYIESAKKIYEDDTLTEEERQAKLYELREWYLEQYKLLSEENQLYRNDLAASGAGLLLNIYEQDHEAYEYMTDSERALVDALINANIDDYQELDDAVKGNYKDIGDSASQAYKEIQDKANDVMSDIRLDWNSGAQEIADLWNKDNGSSVKVQVTRAYEAIEDANEDYKEAVDWCAEAVERNFSEEGIVGAIEDAEEETDQLRDKTVEMAETAIPYLDDLRRYVDAIGEAWQSVQNEIREAISLIEEYLRKMAEANAAAVEQAYAASAISSNVPSSSSSNGTSTRDSTSRNTSWSALNNSTNTWSYNIASSRSGAQSWVSQQGGVVTSIVDADQYVTWVPASTSSSSSSRPALDWQYSASSSKSAWDGTGSYMTTSELRDAREKAENSNNLDLISKLTKAGMIVLSKVRGYATGGYTGSWGDEGKLAILHEKELVLNADDTKNLLAGIQLMHNMTSGLNNSIEGAILQAVANTAMNVVGIKASGISGAISNSSTDNVFNITAEFPNANNVDEIREAILSLPNIASQYVNSNLR